LVADTARNRVEHDCLACLDRIAPGSVPRILFRDAEAGLFAMEFLDERFANWKAELLRAWPGRRMQTRAAKLMATIHAASWGDAEVQARFQTWPNFFALRVEPYLLVTGSRHPKLKSLFDEEAERLGQTSLALAHGDFSPKNILVKPRAPGIARLRSRLVWRSGFRRSVPAEPSFSKALHMRRGVRITFDSPSFAGPSTARAWRSVRRNLKLPDRRLLLMLMLAAN